MQQHRVSEIYKSTFKTIHLELSFDMKLLLSLKVAVILFKDVTEYLILKLWLFARVELLTGYSILS